jgi:glycosyltransferase A (GT-A) superfamily protein (DUF2064 family)
MSQTDRVFTGSIPALYDHHLGPLIFEPYAGDLADRLARMTEGDVHGYHDVTQVRADIVGIVAGPQEIAIR